MQTCDRKSAGDVMSGEHVRDQDWHARTGRAEEMSDLCRMNVLCYRERGPRVRIFGHIGASAALRDYRLLFGTATNDLTGGARRGKGAMVISDTLALSSKRDRQGGGAAHSPTAAAELPIAVAAACRGGRLPAPSGARLLLGRPPAAAPRRRRRRKDRPQVVVSSSFCTHN